MILATLALMPLLFGAIISDIPDEIPCNFPTYRFGNSVYFIDPILQGNWQQAVEYCNYINMEAVSIESKEENQFLFNTLQFLVGVFGRSFWTSGTLTTRGWVWWSTGRNLIYANWDPIASQHKGCLRANYELNNGTLFWEDQDCTELNYLICEKRF